ncbi:aminopeptidase [Texcoconibacillus texcoconensis]|uniref:Aminopeptidase n=1 Tax=Texcoconibacillus texcoconensis TaxID=1095777 RepID=A0A840QS76_9BACI|nr:aminopeptidase [Texcoconibacillus texcoconensis]MBB5174151.1 aminopeptidase [Texcoconibacillus texcoconensis]
MSDFQTKLDTYADLAVNVGVNVQKGQTLVVSGPITSADFVRCVVKKAYEAGAKNVHVEWNDDEVTRTKFELAPDEAFREFPMWRARGFEEMAENGAAFMTIKSTDPDLLKGIDSERIATANKTSGQAMSTFRQYIQSDKVSWCVVAAPSKPWAAKVFPNAPEEEQVNKLWDAIFKATRADLDDAVSAWEKHDQALRDRAAHLNEKNYAKLHYKAPGTDLTIELPEKHQWVGGGGPNKDGVHFVANMPTEEVFTVPKKDGVNGYVTNSKPLNYGGNVIDNFTLTFENGKVVDFTAEEGYDTLKHLLETDEGAKHLGEVALVPHSSPISQSDILFYNTLYDENASNHIALGSAYAFCLEGGADMSEEDQAAHGLNKSITHVDFMIGSDKMDIDAVSQSGESEPLFRNGEWAFDA